MPNRKEKGDSDLVKLVKDLEAKRAVRQDINEILKRLDGDLDKLLEYYQTERQKLILKAEASRREASVQDVQIRNTEQVLEQQLGLRNSTDCYPTELKRPY